MHPDVYRKFHEICSARQAGGAVLEIGAIPSENSLLTLPCLDQAPEKIGINLDGPHRFRDFTIMRGNANAMTCFPGQRFDTILCNATLEHDPFFWKTLAEIRRVAKTGALVVIGVPGYVKTTPEEKKKWTERIPLLKAFSRRKSFGPPASTPTLQIHDFPGDYYRFSPQAVREVFFQGFRDVQIETVLMPPRIIGSGILG